MRQRVETLVPGNRVWISTFHSLGARLLRQYADRLGLDRNFTIYDLDDRNKLVKDALDAAGIDNVHFTPGAHRRARSARRRTSCSRRRAIRASRPTTSSRQTVAQVYPVYEKRLREANAMDFDDLLYLPGAGPEEQRGAARRTRRPLPLRPHRRVPGHQPGPVRDRPRPVDQSPEPVRGRRPGPIDLQVARLRHQEHPRLRARLPRCPRHHARQELPQHEDDPARRRARSSTTTSSGRRRRSSPTTPPGEPVRVLTFETGLDEAEGDRAAHQGRGEGRHAFSYRDFAIFLRINALTRVAGSRRSSSTACRSRSSRAWRSSSARRTRTCSPTCGCSSIRRRLGRFLRVVNEPARGIGKVSLDKLQAVRRPTRNQPASRPPARSRRSPRSRARPRPACATSTASSPNCARSLDLPPHEVIRQVLDKSGYREDARASRTTRRTPSGWPTSRNSSPRPSSSTTRNPETHHRRLPGTDHARQRRRRLGRGRPITSR